MFRNSRDSSPAASCGQVRDLSTVAGTELERWRAPGYSACVQLGFLGAVTITRAGCSWCDGEEGDQNGDDNAHGWALPFWWPVNCRADDATRRGGGVHKFASLSFGLERVFDFPVSQTPAVSTLVKPRARRCVRHVARWASCVRGCVLKADVFLEARAFLLFDGTSAGFSGF
jgi:hypothetical protein